MKHLFTGYIVPAAVLLPIVIGLINSKYWNRAAKIIFIYLLINGSFDLVINILALRHINNLPLVHLFTVVEFISISFFYQDVLKISRNSIAFILLQLGFVIACIVNAMFFQDIHTFNSYTLSLNALILMIFAVNLFAKLFTQQSSKKVSSFPVFWYNTGLFLYFSGSFIYYVFSNYLLYVSRRSFDIIINLHAGFVLIMYIFLAIGFMKCKK